VTSVRPLRLLVAEGNTIEARGRVAAQTGRTYGEGYAEALSSIAPDARIDLCFPADEDAKLPAPLEAYDGVAITGSSLNIYKGEPASTRQVDFARAIFASHIPFFGSCWGLQVAVVATGGEVARNPLGREVAFARKITLDEAGRTHPLHTGREHVFDAPAIHSDEVVRLPADANVTARNTISRVQAVEIRHSGGVFWGVQFHPEFTLRDIAFVLRRYGRILVEEGFFADIAALEADANDLIVLAADPARADIARRLGLGADVLKPEKRLREIANWITLQVQPAASARGRA
jgi:GMP synthase (glutamine-hydrolysing)